MTAEHGFEKLQNLLIAVREDGALDEQELKLIKDSILADRTVSREEAELLFELASELAEDRAKEDFEDIYVKGITSYLIKDGALEGGKWLWLQERIADDHMYTKLEQSLLLNITQKAQSLPPDFDEWVHHLEVHLKEFGGDLDELEYHQRTSFLAELKAFLKRLTR